MTSNNDAISDIIGAQEAILISNDLYGSYTCSAHELAQGFTRPIVPGTLPRIVPKDLVIARETLMTNRKLKLILKIKSTTVAPARIGDLVQVFIKLQREKRGKWYSAQLVLCYDKQSGTVTAPGQNGRTIKAAIQDVRFAITDYELALKHQEASDILDTSLNNSTDVVGKPCCSSVELVGPKPESGFQQDNLIVGSNRPGDLGMVNRCKLGR